MQTAQLLQRSATYYWNWYPVCRSCKTRYNGAISFLHHLDVGSSFYCDSPFSTFGASSGLQERLGPQMAPAVPYVCVLGVELYTWGYHSFGYYERYATHNARPMCLEICKREFSRKWT